MLGGMRHGLILAVLKLLLLSAGIIDIHHHDIHAHAHTDIHALSLL